ncbi:hypothetical protein [Rhizobacter sp. P5_C2]
MFKAIGNLFAKRADGHKRLPEPADDKALNSPRETEPVNTAMAAERKGAQDTTSDAMTKEEDKARKAEAFKNSLKDKGFL